jgi:hypothetical protein
MGVEARRLADSLLRKSFGPPGGKFTLNATLRSLLLLLVVALPYTAGASEKYGEDYDGNVIIGVG